VALQGTLETFALADVLRLLASTKKTGVLRIDGDRGTGELSVVDGELAGASAAGAPRAERPAEVLFELLRFSDGSFIFDPEAPPSGERHDNVDEALADAEEQLNEWRQIEAVIPSPTRQLTLVADRAGKEITLSARQWSAIVAVGVGCTSVQLGERLGLAELPATRIARELVELGAVEVGDEAGPRSVPAPPPSFERPVAPEPVAPPVVDVTTPLDPPPVAPAPTVEPPAAETAPPPPPPPAPPAPSSSFADAPSFVSEPPPPPPAPPSAPSGFAPATDPAPSFEQAPPAFAAPPPPPPAPPAPATDPIASWNDDPDDGVSGFHEDDEPVPLFGRSPEPGHEDPFGPDPFRIPTSSSSFGEPQQADEAAAMARQLANLSPRAQQAVAAAAAANTDEEREQAIARVASDSDEPINRNLLLKYLSSVDE
jgi:hypothetical protein